MNEEHTAEELRDAPILLSLHGRAQRPPVNGSDAEFHAAVLARIAKEPPHSHSAPSFRLQPLLMPLAAAAMLGGVLFLLLRPEPLNYAPSREALATMEEGDMEWLIGTEELHALDAEGNVRQVLPDHLSGEALIDHLVYNELPLDLIAEELPLQ
jgi:hypothetical protein